ncbi:hypothetical protein NECAME_16534, partial [Necator americanus]
WAYNGFQQHHRPPDYFNQTNFGVPPQFQNHTAGMQQRLPNFPLNPNAAAFIPRGFHRPNVLLRTYQRGMLLALNPYT